MGEFEIREDRAPQGRKKLLREREAYLALVDQGLNSVEASRAVGVHPRTGREWRNGRPDGRKKRSRPPARSSWATGTSLSGRFLSESERRHIADLLRENAGVRAIAAELGSSPSTISREVRRNGHPESGFYHPHAAQARAATRRPRPNPARSVPILSCARLCRTG
jgi:transposase, IS30 family